jgi:hypothetical protein
MQRRPLQKIVELRDGIIVARMLGMEALDPPTRGQVALLNKSGAHALIVVGSWRASSCRWLMSLYEDGAGVEKIKSLALHVLLRLGSGLGGDDCDVATSSRGISQPSGQQRGLDTSAAVRERGC